jgi:hypothetical protein
VVDKRVNGVWGKAPLTILALDTFYYFHTFVIYHLVLRMLVIVKQHRLTEMIQNKFITPIIVLIALTYSSFTYCQISSGKYDDGLNLAFNPQTKKVTGYFESYTGVDENTGEPRFLCIFYITGIFNKNGFAIASYYPKDKEDDLINGEIRIKDQKTISIKLKEEHGGCWNVQHFSDEFTDFTLTTESDWIEIRYIDTDKAYFHSDKYEASKRKAYIVKGDIVYIDKIENDWIHCKYFGKTVTEGWIKKETTNKN